MTNEQTSLSIVLLNQAWFAEELRRLGHRVVTVGWVNGCFDVVLARPIHLHTLLSQLPSDFTPNRLVYFDDSYPVNVLGLEDNTIPSLFLSVDAHHHHGWHRGFGTVFSKVLVAQRDYLPEYREMWGETTNHPPEWFPLWAPIEVEPAAEKTIDVCFRGTLEPELHPQRAEFFKKLQALAPVDAAQGNYTECYPRARIVINQTIRGDLNFRVFEAMRSGAMLLTPETGNGLTELFIPGVDIVTYPEGNAEEAASRLRYYLKNEEERRIIAAAGYEKVRRLHTAEARARLLEEHLLNLEADRPASRYLGASATYLNSITSMWNTDSSPDFLQRMNELLNNLFDLSVRNLIRAAEEATVPETELEVLYLLCKSYLDEQRRYPQSLELTEAFSTTFPQHATFLMYYIESLLNAGERNAAHTFASQICPNPEELLAALPNVLGEARRQVIEAIQEIRTGATTRQQQ